MKVQNINRKEIKVADRFREEVGDLSSLRLNIEQNGLIHNLTVRVNPDGGYDLISGKRRFLATEDLEGFDTLPCNVLKHDTDILNLLAIELSENVQRKDMTPIEECKLKARIHKLQTDQAIKKGGQWSAKDTSELLGVSSATLARDLEIAMFATQLPNLFEGCGTKQEAANVIRKTTDGYKRKKGLKKYEDELERASEEVEEVATQRKERKLAEGKLVDRNPSGKPTETQVKISKAAQRKGLIINQYILRPFEEQYEHIQDETLDLIEWDPPYAVEFGYDVNESNQGKKEFSDWTPEEYKDKLETHLPEMYKKLKPDGWLLLWYAFHPWHGYLIELLKQVGFKVRDIPGIWVKEGNAIRNPVPKHNLGPNCEFFLYAKKTSSARLKKAHTMSYIYRMLYSNEKEHFTEKPVELYMDLLSTFVEPGGRIWTPCAGSGNSILAGANLSMFVFGNDLSRYMRDVFQTRVMDGNPGDYNSYRGDK